MPDQVVATPFGKFLVDPTDIIESTTKAGTLWDGAGFLQVLAKQYGRLGEPGVTILDVGANVGTFSIWLASHGAWRVLAVEPVPSTMQRLKANLDLNYGVTADVVIPIQVAAYDQVTELYVPPVDPTNVGGTALTPHGPGDLARAMPLDYYRWLMGDVVSLIKIDAQGCDGLALRGMFETLRRWQPAVVFEWEAGLAQAHGDRLDDVIRWLYLQGYRTDLWPTHANNYLAVPIQGGA